MLPTTGGVVFLAGTGKVGRFDGKSLEVWGVEAGLPAERIDGLLLDGSGTLWVRSTNHLLAKTPDGKFTERGRGLPPSNDFGSLVVKDAPGGGARFEVWLPRLVTARSETSALQG